MKTHSTKEEKQEKKELHEKAAKEYSGIAINRGDNNKVSEKLEKERTCTLNNNRNNDQV